MVYKLPNHGHRDRTPGIFTISAMAIGVIAILILSCGDGGVEPTPPPVATTVTVNPDSATLTALGETVRFAAEVRDRNGQVIAGAAVAWASSEAAVASVDAAGVVTAAANGTATIKAMAGSVSGSATVTVEQTVSAVGVSPTADTLVAFGDTVRFAAEGMDANGHAVPGVEFAWASSDTAVARVDATGLVTAEANGSTTIRAAADSVSGTAAVTVAQSVDSVAVLPRATRIKLDRTLQLVAEAFDKNGHQVNGAVFTWWSSDASVAFVDGASGLVRGVSEGMAIITATSGNAQGRAEITVRRNQRPVTVDSIAARSVNVGDTVTVDVSPYFSDPDGDTLRYEAYARGGEAVASVSGSLVTIKGISEGIDLVVVRALDPDGRQAIQHIRVWVIQPNRAPEAVGSIPAQAVTADENTATVDVSAYFHDPDDDRLSYEVSMSDALVATATVRGRMVTIRGSAAGYDTVTVTARDPDGLYAEQAFDVTVWGEAGVTGTITSCRVSINLFLVRTVVIRGTVTAHRAVRDVKAVVFAEGGRVGVEELGDLSAREQKGFVATKTTLLPVGRPRCSVGVTWLDVP